MYVSVLWAACQLTELSLTNTQSVYGEELNSQDSDYIINYLMRKFGQPEIDQNSSKNVRSPFLKLQLLQLVS